MEATCIECAAAVSDRGLRGRMGTEVGLVSCVRSGCHCVCGAAPPAANATAGRSSPTLQVDNVASRSERSDRS
jgi:hypothetical protein